MKATIITYLATNGFSPRLLMAEVAILLLGTGAKAAGAISTMGWILIVTFVLGTIFAILGFFLSNMFKEIKGNIVDLYEKSAENKNGHIGHKAETDGHYSSLERQMRNVERAIEKTNDKLEETNKVMGNNKALKENIMGSFTSMNTFVSSVQKDLNALKKLVEKS